ncbi:iron-containing redox enzyme family protein [Streptomyces sp. NBC_01216]|uniref:iron-containing redox enzyme family protein n=1 Tax=Streptomyces sp. NBC_01216 TaxID=2903778 RepID=UPI002E0DECFA|nr:iron-containing redox enzyme family protein [Streptomyces sp. NBC_01216]
MHATSPTARAVFTRASDPECMWPGGALLDEVRAELARPAPRCGPLDDLDELRAHASRWAAEETDRFTTLRDASLACGDGGEVVRRTVLSCAPLALLSGAWLQWLSAPGNAETLASLRALSLYASDVGASHPHASRGSAYLTLLRRLRLAEYAVPATRLTQDTRIEEDAFFVPSVLLAMGRRPEDFHPEILGADLCLRSVGLLPALTLVRRAHPHLADWESLDPGTAREPAGPTGTEQALAAVAALEAADGGATARVAVGFRWALGALQSWGETLYARLEASLDPAYGMAELMRLRAREGAVYHHDFPMEGRPLSQWLTECRTDAGPFLDALARSRMVKPGRSEASSLVGGLVGERGPMFRVFAEEDLAVIRRWIDSLPPRTATPAAGTGTAAPTGATTGDGLAKAGSAEAATAGVPSAPSAPSAPALPSLLAHPAADPSPRDIREAYWLLQRRAATPAVHEWARNYVHGWLARSGHGMDREDLQLPGAWPAEGLRPWLSAQHDRHGAEFEDGREVPVPSRDELIDSTVQLAPLTLIDGAWLQGFTGYEEASSDIGFSLFETYWDELGNGEQRLNHPIIYRQVLAEMGVDVPPTGSREFSRWPGFQESSFELPVYWLAIGRFPRTFLPEVLGLNLAMELSGVGGSYRRARMALKAHGFSTRFVDIHNTIDNVSTGHSAWAADAVDTHMATVPSPRAAEVWARVRTGYRSLTPPSGFRARQAQRRARNAAATDRRITR